MLKKRIAAHAASGRTKKYVALKEAVLKKYAAGKYPSHMRPQSESGMILGLVNPHL